MNQHKDLLYLQKYATYQFNNRTFSTQNTKISACSLAISYICFQVHVRIVKKKEKGRGSHTINYYGKSGDFRTPNPQQGLYTRNCNGRNYTSYHSWRPSWRPLFAENSRASRGSAPWAPGRGPTAGPWTPSVWGARCATRTDFPAHLFFCKSPQESPPEASILGVLGSSRPPPQWKYWGGEGANLSFCSPPPPNENIGGGGQTYRFAHPPPPIVSSTWKMDNM